MNIKGIENDKMNGKLVILSTTMTKSTIKTYQNDHIYTFDKI